MLDDFRKESTVLDVAISASASTSVQPGHLEFLWVQSIVLSQHLRQQT